MDFSQFIDKIIELANTPGGFIAAIVISLPLALWLIGGYSKRRAEAGLRRAEADKLDAETKKIRAQGDADTDLGGVKNTAKILDIMQQTVNGDAEKTRMIQAVIEKGREENEQNRKTLDRVSDALTEFNTENKAWRFDFKANTHLIDGSLLGLSTKVEGMSGALDILTKETDDSHLWMRETITSIHDKVTEIHTQVGVIYRLATRPTPPPTEPASAPPAGNIKPLNADGAQSDAVLKPTG